MTQKYFLRGYRGVVLLYPDFPCCDDLHSCGSCHSQTDIPPCGGRWSSNHCRCNAVILPAYCGGTACPCSCSLSCIDTRPSLSGGFICLFCLDAEPPRFRHRNVLPHCHAADVEFGNDSSFQPLHFCIQRFDLRFYQLLLLL